MKHRWNISTPDPAAVALLQQSLGVSLLLSQCLVNRGLSDPAIAERFLKPRLKDLGDPFDLPDMDKAVARLWMARTNGEPVVIFGDYDVDGVSSTAILLEAFESLGWKCQGYLPRRLEEGYGLSRDGVENCLKKHPTTLLLAVDCGSTATETIGWLNSQGVDVLVLDHHQLSDPAPAAVALVNPHRGGPGAAPNRELCSAGLSFKLVHALVKRGREEGVAAFKSFDIRTLLDLVALATIADLVPLTGENRALVSAGLERLSTTQRPGLVALKSVAGVKGAVTGFEVGYQLGPRLNASGRLENAEASLHLLRARSIATAEPLAAELDARNRERQDIEKTMAKEAIGAVRARFNPEKDFVIVEGQLLWHIGVVGIVASRVLREFYRPTLILGGDNNWWRGSGRSVEGFDLAAALRACDDLLEKHGGHAMAAGVTIHPDKMELLRKRLNELARAQLTLEQLQPPLRLDGVVSLNDITEERLAELAQIEPVGQGNPAVQIVVKGLSTARPVLWMGKDQQHAKGWASQGGKTVEWVWWNAERSRLPMGCFALACTAEINEFGGRRTLQLRLLDWRPV